jgi:NAD(P)-dependent dehydrogenase (short-subunit alcohol dehydrogenase family)
MPASLDGRVVVVTGAAGGIGRALCRAFAAAGARLALIDRDADGLAEAAGELAGGRGATGGLAAASGAAAGAPLALTCDVTRPDECGAALDEIVRALGGIDVLVNNAGISHRSLLEATELEVLRRVMEVNLWGAVHCTRAALPALRARRGVVVAVSSVAGFAPLVGRTGYAASKHALHGFFDSLRAELRPSGVDVVLVCPSFVDTALEQTAVGGDGAALGRKRAHVGRLLSPEAVARAVVDGVRRRRRLVLVSPVARAAWWVSKLAPTLYERLMRRSQRSEFPI